MSGSGSAGAAAHHSKKETIKIVLGERTFVNRDDLVVYFRKILRGNPKGYQLNAKEEAVALSLLEHHPNKEKKIGDGVAFIKTGASDSFPDTPAFVIHQKGGKEVDFSYLKIANTIYQEEGKEHAKRKEWVPGLVARVERVDQGMEALLQSFVENADKTKKSRFRLAKLPLIDSSGVGYIQFFSPKDLSDFITLYSKENLMFQNKHPKIEQINSGEEQRYWKERATEKASKLQKKRDKESGRGGRGGGRGGFRGRGGGRGGGSFHGGGGFGSFGGSFAGSKRPYENDREREGQGSPKRWRPNDGEWNRDRGRNDRPDDRDRFDPKKERPWSRQHVQHACSTRRERPTVA